jgi:hypothetical protein
MSFVALIASLIGILLFSILCGYLAVRVKPYPWER